MKVIISYPDRETYKEGILNLIGLLITNAEHVEAELTMENELSNGLKILYDMVKSEELPE